MIQTLNIELSHHSYPIYIGKNILENIGYFSNHIIKNQKILIVTNTTVNPLYGHKLFNTLSQLSDNIHVISLEDGEKYKNWETLQDIYSVLLKENFDRNSSIIALGGGVIGDMSGFAAATFMRGIKFIQVPTTLLAQVDSSIGGKTGINHTLGKNMIGAFYQPQAVISDISTLETLPKRELIAGIAEIIKHAFIFDKNFLDYLNENTTAILNLEFEAINFAIKKSCEIKAEFVKRDEKEQNIRAYLNFGHTFGHAIEAAMGYGNWLHGEGVGCGMAMASELSYELNYISEQERDVVINLIKKFELPIMGPAISVDKYIYYMKKDKKNQNSDIQFIILNGLGSAQKITAPIHIVEKVLHKYGAI